MYLLILLYHILPFASRSVFDDEMPCPEFAAYNFISVYLSVIMGMTVFQRTFLRRTIFFWVFACALGKMLYAGTPETESPSGKF